MVEMPLAVKWPFPPADRVPYSWTLASKVVVAAVGGASKIWAEWLNHIKVYNKSTLYNAVENRPHGQPLLTVTNHQSCCDDPVLWGVLKWNHLVTNNKVMRWSLAASDVCFTKELHSQFFSLGRTIPICRGDGVYQKSMDFVIEKLNQGEWVHTFPEGRVNDKNEFIRFKWGVGRLVAESKTLPLVIPMWHVGMDRILPNRSPYIPHIGKKVTLVIGQPIELKQLVLQLIADKKCPVAMRKAITDRIQEEMWRLKQQAEELDSCSRTIADQ